MDVSLGLTRALLVPYWGFCYQLQTTFTWLDRLLTCLTLCLPVALLAWPFACLACPNAWSFTQLASYTGCIWLSSSLHLLPFNTLRACTLACQCALILACLLYTFPVSLCLSDHHKISSTVIYLLAAISFLIPTPLFIFTCCALLPPSLWPLADRLGRPTAVIRYVCAWLKSTEERTYWLTDLKTKSETLVHWKSNEVSPWQCFVLCVPLVYTDKPCETN